MDEDPILEAINYWNDCRLAKDQAWVNGEYNYWDVIYQAALIAYDEATTAYNSTVRSL
jgi:hypothetical protein